jgi:hypothetical protein
VSFKPSSAEKGATAAQQKVADTAITNSGEDRAVGNNLLNTGGGLINTGVGTIHPALNYFNTLLNGDRANTTAMLQPQIDAIKNANAGQISALSTLMPRGGGRTSTLFNAPWEANKQIQNLFAPMPGMAASNLAGIGSSLIGQGTGITGQGTNLFGIGNQALNTSGQMDANLFNQAFNQRQAGNNFWSGLGGGLFNLAKTPFGASGRSLMNRIPWF